LARQRASSARPFSETLTRRPAVLGCGTAVDQPGRGELGDLPAHDGEVDEPALGQFGRPRLAVLRQVGQQHRRRRVQAGLALPALHDPGVLELGSGFQLTHELDPDVVVGVVEAHRNLPWLRHTSLLPDACPGQPSDR
jgi:hypothetical protein